MAQIPSETLNFGPYSGEVEEVRALASSGTLFKAPSKLSTEEFRIERDLEKALAIAFEQSEDSSRLDWNTLRSQQMRRVYAKEYATVGFTQSITPELRRLRNDLITILKPQLRGPWKELIDDVAGDLGNCAYARALFGKENEFYERLFSIYKAGCWPCGWEGDYPDGRPIVFEFSATGS